MTLGVKVVSMGEGAPIAYWGTGSNSIFILPLTNKAYFIFSKETAWSKTN